MVEVVVLGSGSKGNATLVRSGKSAVLVDAGLSARQLRLRLESVGQDPAKLDAILLTHEHSDHIQGLRVLRKTLPIPVIANEATLAAASRMIGEFIHGAEVLHSGSSVTVGAFEARSFRIPHNAAEPVGWVLHAEGVQVGYATDLGHPTRLVAERLAGSRILVLEANHDRKMLMDGPYPWPTKQRVASREGHLSNEHAAALLPELLGPEAAHVVLAHISETNNKPLLARAAVEGVLGVRGLGGVEVHTARQDEPLAPVIA